MGKTIAIANQKGGVGKTTTTLNFGANLAAKGYKVLMVDLDSQGNLTQYCGLEHHDDLKDTIASVIAAVITGSEVDQLQLPIFSFRENIDFIPSNVTLSQTNLMLTQAMAREFILKGILAKIKDEYDYILIDCAPSLSVDLLNALTAADEVIIVTSPATFSISGTEQLIRSIGRVRANLNPDISIAGVVLNRVDRRTNFANDVIESMKAGWGKYVRIFRSEIPASVRVEESQPMAKPVYEYDKNNKAAQGFGNLTEEYLEIERGEDDA